MRSDYRLQCLVQAAVLAVVIQLPSFADVAKYEPRHLALAPVLLVATFVVFALVLVTYPRMPLASRVVGSPVTTACILVGLALVGEVLYRHELSRVDQGIGSTAAAAMSSTIESLVHGHGLYAVHLRGGAPVSPGPGWLLVNSPFTLAHVYALMDPVWIAVTAVVLRRTYGRGVEVNLGLAFLCCSPAFFRLLGEGHDIIAIGCSMVLLVVVADRCVTSGTGAVLFGLAVGVVATSRIIYLPLPVLLAVFLGRRDPRRAAVVALVGLGTALGLFAVFSLGVHPYPPLHLFGRAGQRQPPVFLAVAGGLMVILLVAAIRRVGPGVTSWFVWFAVLFSTAQLLIGVGELIGGGYHLATWEGANYVFAGAIPVVVATFAVRVHRDELAAPVRGDTPTAPGTA